MQGFYSLFVYFKIVSARLSSGNWAWEIITCRKQKASRVSVSQN